MILILQTTNLSGSDMIQSHTITQGGIDETVFTLIAVSPIVQHKN